MKEINLKKDLTAAGFTIISERYQHISQYNNCGAQLLHKNNAVVYVKDTGDFKTEYLLSKVEREAALKTPDIFLDDMVYEWAWNEENSTLGMYQWFPENIEHNFEEDAPCRVLIVGCYYGYEPINWAKNDAGEDIIFNNPGNAQDWINEQEKGPYMLKHGEAGRPEYFIIS